MSPRAPRPDEEATTRGDTDFRRRLALIFLLGLALRVAYVLLVERGDPLSGDGVYYHRSEEHTSELQSRTNLVCRLLLEKKKNKECQNSL